MALAQRDVRGMAAAEALASSFFAPFRRMTVHRKIGLQAMAGSGHLSPVCRRLGHGQCNTVL